ncbi:hypothetical protein BO94DRAFT_529745 [Aspergillus sclerotioniger CBS 115572]|uniref:Uncharacterized protein n=1 Tax=Aspergillus sclerotioniger CBS 115572 TaxID=1450535 RepID=A0A317XH22_9EURO|nr:hypothetical protein BO94DRAFT_529745 [Aspergillus sclerotioniger CBS 115572]PWY96360.1 hypothetical protein BO94DRAFT_529745 [Aspergillus sclerotioniger CBS 115572]
MSPSKCGLTGDYYLVYYSVSTNWHPSCFEGYTTLTCLLTSFAPRIRWQISGGRLQWAPMSVSVSLHSGPYWIRGNLLWRSGNYGYLIITNQ